MSRIVKTLAVSGALAMTWPMAATADETEAHPLSFMFGEWVGEASGQTREGAYRITQTERVGPALNGDVVVIEGRGYSDTGETMFNAFAVVSPTGEDGAWEMRSYANGRAGTFPFELTETGYVWKLPAGPNAHMVYTATFDGNSWSQIGEYTPASGTPMKTFEMSLTRVGETAWPAGNPVSPAAE